MGNIDSKHIHSKNDFELCIRSSKELEHLLETEFRASGKGLHEKISSVESQLTPDLVKNMRYLATIRNKLVHEHGFDAVPDRARFIKNFDQSCQELKGVLRKRRSGKKSGAQCIIS